MKNWQNKNTFTIKTNYVIVCRLTWVLERCAITTRNLHNIPSFCINYQSEYRFNVFPNAMCTNAPHTHTIRMFTVWLRVFPMMKRNGIDNRLVSKPISFRKHTKSVYQQRVWFSLFTGPFRNCEFCFCSPVTPWQRCNSIACDFNNPAKALLIRWTRSFAISNRWLTEKSAI